jgi:hypothetical protein
MGNDDGRVVVHGAVACVPPPKVVRIAESRDLGRLLGSRKLANPFANAGGWVVISLASLTVPYLLGFFVPKGLSDGIVVPVTRFITVVFSVIAAVAFVMAVRALVMGARAYFMYAQGFVYLHNGQAEVFRWSDVTGLRAAYAAGVGVARRPRHYKLARTSGRPVGIPLAIVDGTDPFADQLVAIVRRLGRPTP